MNSSSIYQVGGCLPPEAPTYVQRPADRELWQQLQAGEFCYILNSRQMGKSSLRARAAHRLRVAGIACTTIDLTRTGNQNITAEQWYAGIVRNLAVNLELTGAFNLRTWWRERDWLSPVQRFSEFIEQILLVQIRQRIVIFIDEIDSVLSLGFKTDEFFAALLACYNRRADNPDYQRLTFALLGVAMPSELIRDPRCAPFNIGCSIQLTGLQRPETDVLAAGLATVAQNPQALLDAILDWSGGSPFLTQKLCQLALGCPFPFPKGQEAMLMACLARARLLDNWEANDEPEHLRTIRDRLLRSPRSQQLLRLYKRLLAEWEIPADDSLEQMELRLTGLAIWCPIGSRYPTPVLRIYNRVYVEVFNQRWLQRHLIAEPPRSRPDYREVVYQHLLACAQVDHLPNQLVARCRNLFLEPATYPKPEIANALRRFAQSCQHPERFNQFVNRCCYIAINHWRKPEQRQAVTAGLLDSFQPLDTLPAQPTRLQSCLHAFTHSVQYRNLAERRPAQHQSPRAARPLKDLIARYPYLYPYQIRDPDPVKAEIRRQQAVRLKLRKQREFAQQLFDYANYLHRPATGRSTRLTANVNPTLLTDAQVYAALNAFVGPVESAFTYREVAASFLDYTRTIPRYRNFKDELYGYLIATTNATEKGARYSKHYFNERLYEHLCNILPENDRRRIDDPLILETCVRLLNFLVVESVQNPEHYRFIDLLANLETVPTIGLLLKLVLLSRRVQPRLEQRFSVLFNHYGTEDVETIRWFVDSLENFNVALGVHFNQGFDFSAIARSPQP